MAINVTLSSMFESQSQALESQLKGMSLPRDAEKIQNIVTNYLNEVFDDEGDFRQNLTQSEDYILQAALTLLNAQKEFNKMFLDERMKSEYLSASKPNEQTKRTEKEDSPIDDNPSSTIDPTNAFIGAGSGALIGKVIMGGWGAVFGAIAGTAVAFYLQGRTSVPYLKKRKPSAKQSLISEMKQNIEATIPLDTNKFVTIVARICESVDNLIATFRAQIKRVVDKYESQEKPSIEKEYRILLESIQSLIGYQRTHSEDEKFIKKIQDRIEDLGETLENYNLSILDYSDEYDHCFEKVKSPNATQLKMVYPAIMKSGNVVLKGKVFIPE